MVLQNIQGLTVVITGPSTGIGRATALELAREGAHLVLAARSDELLEELAKECVQLGAKAIYVHTDVNDPEAMKNLAQKACVHFNGSIDVWINNAGVGAIGSFVETPIDAHDQVIRTNLLGYLHGAHAVLPIFQRQAKGHLINLVSLGSWIPQPYAAAYSASKFGLRGFSDALRGELHSWPDIHISDVFPAVIDTPSFQHAANYAGRELSLPPPVFDPLLVAKALKKLINSPKPRTMVGWTVGWARMGYFLAPNLMRRTMARAMEHSFRKAKTVPITSGNLFEHSPLGIGIRGTYEPKNPAPKILVGTAALLLGFVGFYLLRKSKTKQLETA